MRLRGQYLLAIIVVLLLVTAALPLASLRAQDNNVIISIAVPTFAADQYTDKLFADFSAAHPGITVNVVKFDPSIPPLVNGSDAYFAGLQAYVNAADVLSLDPRRVPMNSAATSAGYFLNLAPLADSDKSLNVDDFYPAVWQSYQWDKGTWALPTSTDALIMSYDPAAFDKAGLGYPSEKWTMDDLVNAVNKLTVKDPSGAVTQAGLGVVNGGDTALFRALAGQGLFDSSAIPNPPQIDTPQMEAILNAWLTLKNNGEIGTSNNDFQTDPISLGAASSFSRLRPNNAAARKGLLLPGNKSVLTVTGFAVSAGTQHPEQAYALASFLTTRPELTRGGVAPARKSLVGAQVSGGGPGGPGGPGGGGRQRTIAPEVQALIDSSLANGLPTAEMRYTEYVGVALKQMQATPNTDAKTALQAVEQQATQDQQAGINKKSSLALAVPTPVPTAVLSAGKVDLKFSYASFVSPMPNQDKWDALIQQFVSTDPQVGRITLDTTPRFGQLDQAVQNFDCFYLPYNAVPSTNLGLLLNIDPFLSADSSFSQSDVVGNVMSQLQRDNKTWAYPIIIQPSILRYSTDAFTRAKIDGPTNGWSIDVFNSDIKALRPETTDPAPFVATNTNGTHLLILMAAYGALPLDYRSSPPKIDFTSPASVDAIRQVLDLARNGYIKYTALGALGFGGGQQNLQNAIYTAVLNAFNNGPQPAANGATTYKPTSYPTGKTMSALSYTIGAAYISATSQNPEACYRWISLLAKHPELFNAMPAFRSQINNPTLLAAQGSDTIALYQSVDSILKDPNTISLPSLAGGGGSPTAFLVQHWLFEAFDSYVLNNGDLDSALKDAQGYATTFEGCAASIPPFDPSTTTRQAYNQAYQNCATTADPRLKAAFSGNGG